jgi:hypothetical protein
LPLKDRITFAGEALESLDQQKAPTPSRAGVFAGRSGELFYDHALRPRRLTREPVFLIVSASLAH